MTGLLSVTDVSKRFRGLTAVSHVRFDVQPGEMFAVIGPNGAGKTTLFNMIAGAMAPDGGSITFAGEKIDGLRSDQIAQRGIGRTFQLVRPFPSLSVEDNVVVGALMQTNELEGARNIAHEIMSQLDLLGKRAQIASSLTLPDRKRLEVARALAGDGRATANRDRSHRCHSARAQPCGTHDPADRACHEGGCRAGLPDIGSAPRSWDC